MNRYDDVSVSKFNPLSLEEIMLVPQLKRKQHDANLIALQNNRLKLDPLQVHSTEALRLKQEMDARIDEETNLLNKEGINSNSINSVIKLNREYQDLIAPTGRAGKINNAKILYDKGKEEFIKNAELQKIGRDRALTLWEEKIKDYTGFDDKNDILNVTPQGVAAFQDYGKDLLEKHTLLGETTKSISSSGHHLEKDDTGGFWEVTKNGERIKSNNIAQIESAKRAFKDSWLRGEGAKYSNDAALNITERRIDDEFDSMLKISNLNKSSQNANYNKPDKADIIEPIGTIISNDSTLKSDALEQVTYENATSEIKRLSTSSSLNSSDRAKLDDLRELQANAEIKMLKDPKYLELQKKSNQELDKWKNLSNKMNLTDQEEKLIKENSKILPQLLRSKGVGAIKTKLTDSEFQLLNSDKSSNFYNIDKQLNSIKDKYWKDSSSTRHNYSYMPSNPKEESIWNLHNENVFNNLKGISDLSNVLDLTSIHTTGGTKKNINSVDVSNIQNLLKSGDSKSFKINNIKTYGDNKTPEITVTFNTTKGASQYDTKGLKWNDEYGGEEKPVTITFKLKKFSNAPALTLVIAFWAVKDPPKILRLLSV